MGDRAGVRSTAEVGLGWAVLVGDEGMDVRVDPEGGEVRSVALGESDGVTVSDGRLQAKFISSRIVSKGRENRRCPQGMVMYLSFWNTWIGDPSFQHDPFIGQEWIDSGEDHPLRHAIGDRTTGGQDDG